MPKQSRQLAVVLFSDIVGYSRLMGKNEQMALEALSENRRIHRESLELHHGVLVKEVGDGTLCRFSSALDAVHCAIDIQTKVEEKAFQLRMGLHLGDILLTENDIFGNSVNIAARVEALANPGAVFLTAQVVQSIQGASNISIAFLGEKRLKNIDEAVRIYGLEHDHLTTPVLPVTLDESGLVDGSILHYSVQEKLGAGGMGSSIKRSIPACSEPSPSNSCRPTSTRTRKPRRAFCARPAWLPPCSIPTSAAFMISKKANRSSSSSPWNTWRDRTWKSCCGRRAACRSAAHSTSAFKLRTA